MLFLEERIEKNFVTVEQYKEFEKEFRNTDVLISNKFGDKDEEIKHLHAEYHIFKRE